MAESIEKQLAKIILKNARTTSGETLQESLSREVQRLYQCIQYYIDEYYSNYEPVVYQRSYRLQGAMYAQDFIYAEVKGNSIQLSLLFRDDLSAHDNLFGSHKSYVPILMNFGWKAPKLARIIGRSVHRLTYFEGIHFIEQGIADFNKSNTLGIKINVDITENNIPIYQRSF
jgi:hypothetical protein